MDRQALLTDLVTGEDDVILLKFDCLDFAAFCVDVNCVEGELPFADTQVATQGFASSWRAHIQHVLFFLIVEEGLSEPETEVVVLEELLPLLRFAQVGLVWG